MRCNLGIKIPRMLSKLILWLTRFFNDQNLVLVCKGYGDDYGLYTGLDWEEDSDLDLVRDKSYSDFRLWINLKRSSL